MSLPLFSPPVQNASSFFGFAVDVLRLDLVHPVVSGNKWYKLKGYLVEAKASGKQTLLTFGGAYSNHIVATAAAAEAEGMKSVGIICGERPSRLSHTLQSAMQYGMQLHFVTRTSYRQKQIPPEALVSDPPSSIQLIPEGGYGHLGMAGAKDILNCIDALRYSHIVCAVGTGTTLAGLAAAALPRQKVLGVSALKNAFSLQAEIEQLLPSQHAPFELLHNHHFGGYARQTPALINFMNAVYAATSIPTDFLYTAKAFYAVYTLAQQHYFNPSDKVLLIHTGGLQGNRTLPAEALNFLS